MNIFATKVYAQGEPPRIEGMFGIIDSMLDKIMPVVVLLCVAMFIVGGYMWIVSGGNPESTKKAQGTMTWAVIGFVFVFLARMILTIVYDFVSG